MFGIETIRQINEEAAQASRLKGLEGQLVRLTPGFVLVEGIQHIGYACDEVDKLKERVDTLFVDTSGFGAPGEPALTHDQFDAKLRELAEEHGTVFVALEEMGQFQGHVAVWTNK